MSETPISDALWEIHGEGLNARATSELADMALADLKLSMPEYFDENGEPYKMNPTIIATSHEPYFRDSTES